MLFREREEVIDLVLVETCQAEIDIRRARHVARPHATPARPSSVVLDAVIRAHQDLAFRAMAKLPSSLIPSKTREGLARLEFDRTARGNAGRLVIDHRVELPI